MEEPNSNKNFTIGWRTTQDKLYNMENKDWNSDEMFMKRYGAMAYALMYMTGAAFNNGMEWLEKNEPRYLDLISHKNVKQNNHDNRI